MPGGGEIGQAWWEADLKDEKLKAKLRELDGLLRQHGETSEKALNQGWNVALDNAGRSLQKVGGQMKSVGNSMTANLTVPIVGLGAATSKMAFDFDETMSQIVALTSVGRDEIGGFRDEILALGPAVGKGPQELAEAFYFVASAGFEGAEAMEVLKVTSKAAAAGLGDTATVAQVVGSAINAYGRENLTAVQATDALVAAIGEGSAEAPEFAGALGNVIGSAAQIGASFPDVTGAIAAMTNVGVGAAESVTSLNQVFTTLFKPTAEAADALAEYGLSASGLRTMISEQGLMPTLALLAEKFEGNAEATSLVFGNVRALRGVLALTGGDMERTSALLDRVADSAGATGEAFDSVAGEDSFKLRQSLAELQAIGIELGTDVLPVVVEVLQELAGGAREFSEWWRSLDDDTKRFIVQMAAFIAVAGPAIRIIGTLTGGVGGLVRAIAFLGGPKSLAFMRSFATGFTMALGPIGMVVAAIGGLVLAFQNDFLGMRTRLERDINDMAMNFGEMGDAVHDLAGDTGMSFQEAKDAVRDYMEETGASFDTAVRRVRTGTLGITDAQRELVIESGRQWEEYQKQISGAAETGARDAQTAIEGLSPEVVAELEAAGIPIGNAADDTMGEIDEAAAEAREAALEHMRNMLSGITNLFETDESLRDAWQALIDRMDDPYTEAERKADIFSKATIANIRAAIASGDPDIAGDTALLVENMLGQIELMEPGALSSGQAVPPAIRDGMDASMSELIDWIDNTLIPGGLASLTMEEADEIGLGNIWRYAQGIRQGELDAFYAGEYTAERAKEGMQGGNFYGGGMKVAYAWIAGIKDWNVLRAASAAGATLAGAAGLSLRGLSPPKEGPLKHIDEDAARIGMAWVGGWGTVVNPARAMAEQVAAAARAGLTLGASGFAFESNVASLAPAGAGFGGGDVPRGTVIYQREVHLHTEGPTPVDTEEDLVRLLDRTQWVAEPGGVGGG
jgi:TP901 family phage tail tape measure protein